MATRRSRRARREAKAAGKVPYLGRIPVPPKPERVITPKPKRPDRSTEKARLRGVARDPDHA